MEQLDITLWQLKALVEMCEDEARAWKEPQLQAFAERLAAFAATFEGYSEESLLTISIQER